MPCNSGHAFKLPLSVSLLDLLWHSKCTFRISMKLFGLMLATVFALGAGSAGKNNSGQAGVADDFQLRCRSKGVIRCFAFDTSDEVLPRLRPAADGNIHALVDASVKASGAGALRFDIMPHLGANSSGSFALDFSREFSSGEEFYVQWRQRFDREMITRAFQHGEGWKQAIIGGDGRPLSSAGSCTPNEVVVQNSYQRGFPQMYHSCGLKDGDYEPLTPAVPPSDFLLQDATGCRYSDQRSARCLRYLADQWMTFQVHVKIGKWYVNQSGNYHRDSTVELWVAEENKPSVLVISVPDYDLVHEKTEEKYGNIWLLPYNTSKDPSENHPVAHTWYDELIISKARIPDPGVDTPNPPDSLSATASSQGVDLKWRANSEAETGFQIERCAGAIYECEASQAFKQIGSAPARAVSFADKTAGAVKRYTYRIRAENKAGNSAYTNPASNVPKPPSDLVAVASGAGVNLSWSDHSQDETDFIIVESCRGEGCSNFAEVARLPESQTRYSQTGLKPGATYRFRVRSANAAGSWTAWNKGGTAYSNIASVALR